MEKLIFLAAIADEFAPYDHDLGTCVVEKQHDLILLNLA